MNLETVWVYQNNYYEYFFYMNISKARVMFRKTLYILFVLYKSYVHDNIGYLEEIILKWYFLKGYES